MGPPHRQQPHCPTGKSGREKQKRGLPGANLGERRGDLRGEFEGDDLGERLWALSGTGTSAGHSFFSLMSTMPMIKATQAVNFFV
mmetsp:Transcript_58674/g.171703  ORF Transcript_58674/g.171703 Transcript_58674/m.171703 type:complete len:85 (-) Transcript_58674:1533-1787(-)